MHPAARPLSAICLLALAACATAPAKDAAPRNAWYAVTAADSAAPSLLAPVAINLHETGEGLAGRARFANSAVYPIFNVTRSDAMQFLPSRRST